MEDWIGVPFRAHGRVRQEGLDCWGLICAVYWERWTLELPSYDTEYHRPEDAETVGELAALESRCWNPVEEPRLGDVALLRVQGHFAHVGLVVARGLMLHTMTGIDSALERYNGPAWGRRLVGFYRHPALWGGQPTPEPLL